MCILRMLEDTFLLDATQREWLNDGGGGILLQYPTITCEMMRHRCYHCVVCNYDQYYYLKRALTLLLLNTTCPVLSNSVDPDQLASKPTDLDLHCLTLNM